MELKKQQILETASKLFLEKGYPKTSMQDIAEGCNFSKATIYKFFSSKESVGMLVVFYLTGQMTEMVEAITMQRQLAPREILKEIIIERMKRFAERNRFMDELLFSLSTEQREKYLPAMNKSRFNIFEMFSGIIMKAFDIEDEVAASELAINLNGLIKEITFVAGEDIIELDEGQIADFIIDSLEAIMEKRKNKKSLLTREQLQALRNAFEHEERLMRPVIKKKRLMQTLKGVLEDYEQNSSSSGLSEAENLIGELKKLEESEEMQHE